MNSLRDNGRDETMNQIFIWLSINGTASH